jgi:hypothetical protein
MRQHKILTRILLILSIINFALAAPAARWRPEVRLDANVRRDVTAASQKPGSSLDGPDHAPAPSPDFTDTLPQTPYADSPPLTPTPDHAPDHAPAPSPDLADILSHAHTPPTPGYAPDYALTPSPDLTDILPYYANLPPTTPTSEHALDHEPAPSPDLAGILPYADSTPPTPGYAPDHAPAPSPDLTNILSWYGNSPTPDHGLDHVPAPSPDLADILSEIPHADSTPPTGSRGNHQTPTPPQSPGVESVDPGTHSLPNLQPYPAELEFWDKVFMGKFPRRISGSDAVNLAQKDTRSRIF